MTRSTWMSGIAAAAAFALAACASDPAGPTNAAPDGSRLAPRAAPSNLLVGTTYYADEVVSFSQGTQTDGGAIPAIRSDPTSALGPSDGPGDGTFVSLGFGGTLVVKLNQQVSGDLAIVHEVTFTGGSYPEEKLEVFVSNDGVTYVSAGIATNNRPDDGNNVHVSTVPLPTGCWQYIKVVDRTDISLYGGYPDGNAFDVDAIGITNAKPCAAPAGCSPGYFKTHLVPGEENTFQFYGVNDPRTLRTALDNPAGGPMLAAAKSQLLHQAAAAILNSILTPGFPKSTAEIVAMTNTALASTDRSAILATKDALDALNNIGCTLGNKYPKE